MGRLIVIEGLDGSGKQTLTKGLAEQARATGLGITTMAFPRYGVDIHADLVRDALYGRLGDLSDSVYGTALLFALDRRAAAQEIRDRLTQFDLVVLDRYVSSNAAYGAARLGGPEVDTGFPEWVLDLEIGRFGLPRPDRQVLLATPRHIAAQRAAGRAEQDSSRSLDRFESDAGLQERTAAMYERFAAEEFLSPWTVLRPDRPVDLLAELVG
ncbi:dTMP kinase [Nakamurella panacisegetis]|uniref:Thymidylate kinase n=1 Tax=Nakamurella panacisegetis TaxID=1090615 RepID=A0A1H0I746_9ACTN|nr:dTMP kinase [Nakamurella panacisegetis]SDO27248.1 dTMP kinase [Nakamurella panacisegetis]